VVELRQGPIRDALAAASRVLATLATALPADATVVMVPGNHDHHLLDGWWARRAADGPPPPLGLEEQVQWTDADPVAMLAQALAPARLEVRYPGVWLREDVYATHGHYLDRHTTVPVLERLSAGVMARLLRAPLGGTGAPDDYEAILRPIYAWIHAVAQLERVPWRGTPDVEVRVWRALEHRGSSAGGGQARAEARQVARGRGGAARRRALSLGLQSTIAALNLAGLGPLRADLSAVELRRAGTRAFGQVLESFQTRPAHAIFGHTHRAGPLPGDDLGEWMSPGGTLLCNSGCWVPEHQLGEATRAGSPYRPGFCVWVADEGPPRLVNLLDGRDAGPAPAPERPGRPARA